MRTIRVLAVWILVVVIGLTGALPQVSYAQDDDQPAGASRLYLPMTVSNGVPAPQTPEASSPTALVVADVSAAEQVATETFWTRDRMQTAILLDRLHVTAAQAAVAQSTTAAMRLGPRGFAPATLPDAKAEAMAKQQYAAEWERAEANPQAPAGDLQAAGVYELDSYSSAPPFDSYYVNDATATWKAFPWITMGRIFFRIPGLGTQTYACSAAAAYGRAVWTAGHCVYTQGRGWSTNLFFVPAYRAGAYPYGSFSVKSMSSLTGWVSQNNLAYDIGMVAVNDRSGLKLSQWVGSLGFMYNTSATQMFHAFGYPGNYSAGAYLVACASSTYRRDTLPGPQPIGIGCDMSNGSSGGPWLIAYAPFKGGLTNYINSLVSYSYTGEPSVMYGPYFSDGAKWLFDWGKTQ